jgi:hypothetical protein
MVSGNAVRSGSEAFTTAGGGGGTMVPDLAPISPIVALAAIVGADPSSSNVGWARPVPRPPIITRSHRVPVASNPRVARTLAGRRISYVWSWRERRVIAVSWADTDANAHGNARAGKKRTSGQKKNREQLCFHVPLYLDQVRA